jgi:hypothetical protein
MLRNVSMMPITTLRLAFRIDGPGVSPITEIPTFRVELVPPLTVGHDYTIDVIEGLVPALSDSPAVPPGAGVEFWRQLRVDRFWFVDNAGRAWLSTPRGYVKLSPHRHEALERETLRREAEWHQRLNP